MSKNECGCGYETDDDAAFNAHLEVCGRKRDDGIGQPTRRPWHVYVGGNFVKVVPGYYEQMVEETGYLGGAVCAMDDWTGTRHDPKARHVRANAELICAAVNGYEAQQAVRSALEEAAEPVCSLLCPSSWKTGSRPPHSDVCKRVQAALALAKGEEGGR